MSHFNMVQMIDEVLELCTVLTIARLNPRNQAPQ